MISDLARLLDKGREDFTRKDISAVVGRLGIRVLNFRFVAGDGRLRTLSFALQGERHLDRLLTAGERVDGSSVFKHLDAGASDLYVVPTYRRAFVNPFSEVPALDVMCSFFNGKGEPLAVAPENILSRACQVLRERTGYGLECLAELEYYVLSESATLYPTAPHRGYGQSAPFSSFEALRTDAMLALVDMGFPVKYGHNEVGTIHEAGQHLEQHEIELGLMPAEQSADAVVLARWVLRMVSQRHGVAVTFAPKLVHGLAGSGMHIHSRLVRDGENRTADASGLTPEGRKQLAGYLSLAPSLTAFGNCVPISYLRLVPNQEAPVYVCWGQRNRCALVRVPLGWQQVGDMASVANPRDVEAHADPPNVSTMELRSPDGSADAHLLHAGLVVAARYGLEMEGVDALVSSLLVTTNIFLPEHEEIRRSLQKLPASCGESAEALLQARRIYEEHGVFTTGAVDGTVAALRSHGDEERSIATNFEEMNSIISKYLHCA